MTRRRSRFPTVARALAVAVAAGLTVALSQVPVGASFVGTSHSSGNTLGSGVWCANRGTVTLTVSGDSWVDSSATTANYKSDSSLKVQSSSSAGNNRTWVRFDLPAVPAGCSLTAATLRMYARTTQANRSIAVQRGAPTPQWTSADITWGTQPALAGTAVSTNAPASAGWQSWGVRTLVQEQYANGNNGFVLKDVSESSGTTYTQTYADLQDPATPGQLLLTWG